MEGKEAPVPQEVQQQPEQPDENLGIQIVGNHVIRERILYFAIYPENGKKILREALGSLRLVQKSWLKTITLLSKMSGDPLYKLVLDGNNSSNESPLVKQHGKILDQFVESVTSTNSPLHDIIPLFTLTIQPSFFQLENYTSLYNCLQLCGAELLEIKMVIRSNGATLPGKFYGNLSLPRLKKFGVQFSGNELTNLENGETVIAHDSGVAFLLQPFLSGANALTEFVVTGSFILFQVPSDFHYLTLGPTLTEVRIGYIMDSNQVELLANCSLPHLTHLEFCCVPDADHPYDAFYKVFNNFRLTLRTLSIIGPRNNAGLQYIYGYNFPVMEKLECFKTSSIQCGLRYNPPPALETYLPKLQQVSLQNQVVMAFDSWTEDSNFSSVKCLKIMLTRGDCSCRERDRFIHNLDREKMLLVHTTFPNVTQLELTTSSVNVRTCGFKYLFMEMRQLVYLGIDVEGSSIEADSNAFWDALLTGIPQELAASLKACPEFLDKVEIKSEGVVSIVRLKELKCLRLLDKRTVPIYPDSSMRLISDIAFQYALLKMTKLEEIYLMGRFTASARIIDKCKSNGKTIYRPAPPTGIWVPIN